MKKPRILAVLDKASMRFEGPVGLESKFLLDFFSIFFHFSINWQAKLFSRMVPKFYCIFMSNFPRASLVRLRSTYGQFPLPASRNRFTFRFFLDSLKNTTSVRNFNTIFYPEPKHAIRLVARYIEDFLAMYDRAGEEVE